MKTSHNTILITGGTSGIGLELATQLMAVGNTVIVTGREQARLAAAQKKLPELHAIPNDVSDPKAIPQLFDEVTKEFPALNVLINNAGIMRKINLHDPGSGLEDLTREIDINLCGPVRMAKQFLPHLRTRPAAAIVNVSSGLAFVPLPISPVYYATKAAIHSFTQSLRVQLKNTRIQVFELAPPATGTPLLTGDFHPDDVQGVRAMDVAKMVREAIQGLQNDQIGNPSGPEQRFAMSLIAPQFMLKQLSKPVDRMLST